MNQDMIRAPEFSEHKYQANGEYSDLPQINIVAFILAYQKAVVDHYEHLTAHGDLSQVPLVDEEEYKLGSDEDRVRWRHAGRQQALWAKLSIMNGELLRRVHAGRNEAINIMKAMTQTLIDDLSPEGSVSVDVEEENEKAQAYPQG